MNSYEVKEAARKFGADLAGIAAIEKLRYLPDETNPLSIHSRAKSVIVLARKVLRGSLRGVEQNSEYESTYPHYGLYGLEDNFLAKTTYDLTIWIERYGFEAVPLFAYETEYQPAGIPVAPEKPAPNVILPYQILAQAAGLGEIGLNGLFLTPEFGPRQRFSILVSDAELEADAPFKPHICDDCQACIKACPLGALHDSLTKSNGLKDYERPVAVRDNLICLQCRNGAVQTNEGRFYTVDRMAAACNRACIVALEERDMLTEKFHAPFRQGKVWQRDFMGNIELKDK